MAAATAFLEKATTLKKPMTIDEFLAFEELAESKHEFENGTITEMAGGTDYHSALKINLVILMAQLRGEADFEFEIRDSDLKIWIPAWNQSVYPDMTIITEERVFRDAKKLLLTNPAVIFEVLSDSTERYDRGEKFRKYQSLPSLKEYILVSQNRPQVDVFYKKNDRWPGISVEGLASKFPIHSLGLEGSMQQLYRNIPGIQ